MKTTLILFLIIIANSIAGHANSIFNMNKVQDRKQETKHVNRIDDTENLSIEANSLTTFQSMLSKQIQNDSMNTQTLSSENKLLQGIIIIEIVLSILVFIRLAIDCLHNKKLASNKQEFSRLNFG